MGKKKGVTRQEVEFSYDVEPPDGSSHEEFSTKIQTYLDIRFGASEVVHVFDNLTKEGSIRKGCDHKYSIVLKFDSNSLANQIKQKFQGMPIYTVTFYTSWWPKKSQAPAVVEEKSAVAASKVRGKSLRSWSKERQPGRYSSSWRDSSYSISSSSSSYFKGSRDTRQSYREGYSSSSLRSGHSMFRRSEYHSSQGSFSEDRKETSPSPAPTHSRSSSLTQRRSPVTRKKISRDSVPDSPERVRRISMASSTSDTNSEHGSEKKSTSSGSSVVPYRIITSPIRVDTPTSEKKAEGRVLRSHSSQAAEDQQRKTLLTRPASSCSSSSLPKSTGSRYNTRSKKRSLEEKETVNPKRHQGRRSKSKEIDFDVDSRSGKRSAQGMRRKERMSGVVALERVVTIAEDSDSSLPRDLLSGTMSGTGEESRSEEEVWVEKTADMDVKQEHSQDSADSGDNDAATYTGSCTTSINVEQVDGRSFSVSSSIADDTTHVTQAEDKELDNDEDPSYLLISEVKPREVLETTSEEIGDQHGVGYQHGLDPRILLSPHEERDETPPAELLEATQQYMMQGDYSKWYRENFQNDPQAWQRYLEYYNAIMMGGGSDGDASVATAEDTATSQPVAAAASTSLEEGEISHAMEADSVTAKQFSGGPCSQLQRTQSLPPASSEFTSPDSTRYWKSMSPDPVRTTGHNYYEQILTAMATPTRGVETTQKDKELLVGSSMESREVQVATGESREKVDCGSQAGLAPSETTNKVQQTKKKRKRRLRSKKYGHLQLEAMNKFYLTLKPLVESTETMIRHSPASEGTLMSALEASLENLSTVVSGEFWNKVRELKNHS